jgi:hypothetical protein
LLAAAASGHHELMQVLINAGADVEAAISVSLSLIINNVVSFIIQSFSRLLVEWTNTIDFFCW